MQHLFLLHFRVCAVPLVSWSVPHEACSFSDVETNSFVHELAQWEIGIARIVNSSRCIGPILGMLVMIDALLMYYSDD